jgi:hypothetical protein
MDIRLTDRFALICHPDSLHALHSTESAERRHT